MNEEIMKALESLELPCYFIDKKDAGVKEYIIFSYSEIPSSFSDNNETLTQYLIFINLFKKDNFLDFKKRIIEEMTKLGYVKKSVPNAYWESDFGLYNQAFTFIKIVESEG